MTKPLPPLEPVARLAARFSRFAPIVAPGRGRAGVPVPVPGPDGVRIAILLTATEPVPDADKLRLQAPSHLVSARADTGELVELAAITPRDLGIAEDPDVWLGEIPAASGSAHDRARLFDLLDETLPAFASGPAGLTAGARRAARELTTLFPDVAEAPLLPYYRALGRRFFAWVDRAAAAA